MSATRALPTPVSPRKIAIVAGILYLLTHVTSVAARLMYAPVLTDPGYVLGDGAADTVILVAALFEVVLALAVVGTAVTLYPVVRRYNEGVAIGYVGLRTLEAGVIAVGVVSILAVVTLREDLAGTADPAALGTVAAGLVALHDWAFLVGPGLVCGTNTVLLAYLMLKSRLVPRYIAILGLVGGPLVFVGNLTLLFGFGELLAPVSAIFVLPVFAWEITLAVTLIVRGFRPEPATVDSREPVTA
jgi:hypothetical protein